MLPRADMQNKSTESKSIKSKWKEKMQKRKDILRALYAEEERKDNEQSVHKFKK